MLKIEHSFLFDKVMKNEKQKIEEVKKVEGKTIERIAEALVFIPKELYQEEKELKNNQNNLVPSDYSSAIPQKSILQNQKFKIKVTSNPVLSEAEKRQSLFWAWDELLLAQNKNSKTLRQRKKS